MESQPLVLTDPNLLAEFVRESEFKTFFEKRFASPPDLAALLFRDGAFVDAFKGTQFSVGGLWEKMKGVIGGSHHYAIMLADLKPFQVQFPVEGVSKDKVEIAGIATLELQLNPDKPGNILGLMGGVSRNQGAADSASSASAGRKALSTYDVVQRFEPQFKDRVFESVIGRHNADEIRGNRGMQDQLQADMMQEAERMFGDVGLMVRNASVAWAMNDVEREQYEKAKIARQQEMLDYQLGLLKREIARQAETTEVTIRANTDAAKLQRASADELQKMVLDSEVSFVDQREAHARRQEMEALKHEIEVLRTEDMAKAEKAVRDITSATDATVAQQGLRKAQLELDRIDQDYRRESMRLEKALELDVTKTDLNIESLKHDQELKITRDMQDLAASNLERMNRIDGDKADRDTDREIKKKSAETDIDIRDGNARAQQKVDQMLAAGNLTPEQLQQLMPGLSKNAADVAIEQAKAKGTGAEEVLRVAREMMDESREHEHRMFATGMQGGTGMAAGLGGRGVDPVTGTPDRIECPECGRPLAAKARFCTGCGHQLRT